MDKLNLPAGLQPPDTAPKDGTLIMADFLHRAPVTALWNGHEQQWVAASVNANLINGEWKDMYFENEYHEHSELIGWLPLPEIQGIKEEAGFK